MMNAYDTLNDIEWQALIRNVGAQFNDLTIKRGFQYYKQGKVRSFETNGAGEIEAAVAGSDLYRVRLHVHTLADSRCSCPVAEHCKHIIAVLLQYVSHQGRSVHAIVNAHSTVMLKQTAYDDPILGRKGQPDALKEKANQIPDMSIAEWYGLFKLCIIPLEFSSQNAQYARNGVAAIYAVKPQLSSALEQLFDFHAHLFMLLKLIKPEQRPGRPNSYMGYHTQVAADELLEAIRNLFEKELAINAEPEQWPRVIKTLTFLRRQMLTEPGKLHYLFEVYDQLWVKWIYPNRREDMSLYDEELQKLRSAEEELGDTLSRLPWMLAQSRIHFLMAEDMKARTWLQAADKATIIPHHFLFSFLEALSAGEEWSRLQTWLVQIGSMLSSHRKDHWQHYMQYWTAATKQLPEAEQQMWDTLIGMLPHSREVYEEALLSYGKWQQWMDVQLSAGKEPLDFRVAELQPLEKNAPELLLPFYHQAVERYILLKNRSSYKAAVKLLKRLSKLYKKMKQEERWESYINLFTSRHSRLRALQEELRKGKLI